MRRALALTAAVLLPTGWACAQDSISPGPATDHREAMQRVAWMVGTWEGSGWMVTGPGGRKDFRGREVVEERLDGLLIVIEGTHRAVGGERDGDTIHHAFAVLSWDPDTTRYLFRSYLETGRAGDYAGQVAEGAFIWGMNTPRGKIRYTIRLDDRGHWVEIGERSADGTSWQQFFAMDLRRSGGQP